MKIQKLLLIFSYESTFQEYSLETFGKSSAIKQHHVHLFFYFPFSHNREKEFPYCDSKQSILETRYESLATGKEKNKKTIHRNCSLPRSQPRGKYLRNAEITIRPIGESTCAKALQYKCIYVRLYVILTLIYVQVDKSCLNQIFRTLK